MVNLIQYITSENRNTGWSIENVDATDHPSVSNWLDVNQVVKGFLSPGYAFDVVAVGSYAHRYRQFWTNLIPTNLLHTLVEEQFLLCPAEQSVQDILEPGHYAQNAQHKRMPGPHKVNVKGEPLKAFSTFVTTLNSDAHRSQDSHSWSDRPQHR
jgi:hypothetical protein